jgi:hypothetical protein
MVCEAARDRKKRIEPNNAPLLTSNRLNPSATIRLWNANSKRAEPTKFEFTSQKLAFPFVVIPFTANYLEASGLRIRAALHDKHSILHRLSFDILWGERCSSFECHGRQTFISGYNLYGHKPRIHLSRI